MKKLKPIIITGLLFLLSIVIFQATSKTANIGIGKQTVTVDVNGTDWSSGADLILGKNKTFCIQQGKTVKNGTTYAVRNYVRIEGRKATFYKENYNDSAHKLAEHTNDQNLIMAWILSQGAEESIMTDVGGQSKYYANDQRAVYGYFPTWASANDYTIPSNSGGYSNQDWVNRATEYVNAYKKTSEASITNNTNKNNLKKEIITYNGAEYIKIGAFNVTYTGKFTNNVGVYDQNNNKISVKYAKYNGNSLQVSDTISGVAASGQDFYILVPTNSGASKISKINFEVSATAEQLIVDLWILQHDDGAVYQNLITAQSSKSSTTVSDSMEITDIELFGKLIITKTDKDTAEKLANVGFRLKMISGEKAGQYVSLDGSGNAVYSSSPTDIKTDANGQLVINSLYQGTYELTETSNPNFGYSSTPVVISSSVVVNPGQTTTQNVTNEQVFANLLIKKTDEDTGEKLSGIGFTLQMLEGEMAGKYVSIDADGNAVYVDSPVNLMTDENGEIFIKNLYKGKYELIETVNPYYYYDEVPHLSTNNLVIDGGEERTLNVTNKKVYGGLLIEKTDKDTGEILSDIGFTIQMKDGEKAGQYVSIGDDAKAVYSSTPTTLYTDKNGQIEIYNMYPGTYEVIETENPYFYYADTPLVMTSDLKITVGEKLTYDMKNEKVFGKLVIDKTDKDTGEILPNIGFTIQMKDGEKAGQYVSIGSDTKADYSSTPTTIYTDENGHIEINNMYPGTYEVVEVENPYDFYENTPFVIASDVKIEVGKELNYDMKNEKVYGNLVIVKTDEDTGEVLPKLGFTIQMLDGEKAGQYVSINDKGKADYSSTPTTIYTDENGRIEIKSLYPGTYEVVEVENPYYGYERVPLVITSDVHISIGEVTNADLTNKMVYGKFKLTKTDEDTGVKLSNIGFTLQMLEGEGDKEGQYVSIDQNGEAVYSTTPTTIYTDENGEINISYIYIGTYELIETENPHFGYEDVPKLISSDIVITPGETVSEYSATNKREYIKISGFAWEDRTDGKNSTKDYEWVEGTEDRRLQYVTVRLKNANGQVMDETTTDENGEYIFGNYDENPNAVKIRIDDLVGAYIEFEYNGMSYQSIPVDLQFDSTQETDEFGINVVKYSSNTNKSSDEELRPQFNNNFSTISKGRASNGNYSIRYNYDSENHLSTVIYGDNVKYGYEGQTYPIAGVDEQYEIQAVTEQRSSNALCTDLTPDAIRKDAVVEIGGLNLGVEERVMPDLFVLEDMQDVQISLNGYTHTYQYAQRFEDPENYAGGDPFNVTVRFANKYLENSYSREVYSSDIVYNQHNPESLQILVTYVVKITNESTVYTRLNTLANYYDARYENVVVKDDQGNTLNSSPDSYNQNGLRRVNIQTNNYLIAPGETKDLYITYQLNNDAINALLNETLTLDSVSEVASYSSFSDAGSTPYAGIDVDSAPDTVQPRNVDGKINITDTIEDDTDKAPSLILNVKEGRMVAGTVWEDSAREDLLGLTGYDKERKGDGVYDEANENVVENAKVELLTVTGSGYELANLYKMDGTEVPASTMTNAQGDYEFSGVIPANYVIRYTYGDNDGQISAIYDKDGNKIEEIQADDYKSTIYRGGNNASMDAYWYRAETSNTGTSRLSDARDTIAVKKDGTTIDDIVAYRTTQDEEMNYQTTLAGLLKTVSADTASFEIKLDYDVNLDNTSGYGVDLKFLFDNIDLGIIERPRQYLDVDKKVANLQIVLPNGNDLVNGNPETDNLQGVRVLDDDVYIEIDNEIIQGATLRINYAISVDNSRSEIDYNSEDYYIYGQVPANKENAYKVVKVVDMYDYLPEDLVLQEGGNWQRVDIQAEESQIKGIILADKVYDAVKDHQNVVHLASQVFENMKPGEVATDTSLVVSKQLSTSTDDLTYENDVEIVKLKGGKTYDSIPGNYDPTTNESYDPGTDTFTEDEPDDDEVEVTITPPTGEARSYWIYVIIGISTLIVIGAGVVIIKKKVL